MGQALLRVDRTEMGLPSWGLEISWGLGYERIVRTLTGEVQAAPIATNSETDSWMAGGWGEQSYIFQGTKARASPSGDTDGGKKEPRH